MGVVQYRRTTKSYRIWKTDKLPSGRAQMNSAEIPHDGAGGRVLFNGCRTLERYQDQRWNVASDVVVAWMVTLPAAALFGAAFYSFTNFFLNSPARSNFALRYGLRIKELKISLL